MKTGSGGYEFSLVFGNNDFETKYSEYVLDEMNNMLYNVMD